MVKLSEDERERQSPGYATLTLASVTVQNGIEDGVGEFTGTFAVDGFENVKVNGPDIREDSSVSEVFAIGIHSVDQGFPGVGSGEVGDASSLIGLKILQVGEYSDVEIPIYPVYTLTDVRADIGGPLSQRFPPGGVPPGEATVQAAVYTDRFSDSTLPAPVATSNEVTVTNEKGLAQNPNRRPLKVEDGELVEVGSESTPSLTSIQGVTVGTTSREQYDTLESVTLADPFTVRVTNNSRARQDGKVEITAYYDEFEEAPNDTLGPAPIPGGYDKDGMAEFTIGSAGTGADLETGIAPGSVSNDMTHINQIRFENAPDEVQVETQ